MRNNSFIRESLSDSQSRYIVSNVQVEVVLSAQVQAQLEISAKWTFHVLEDILEQDTHGEDNFSLNICPLKK